MSTQRVVIVIPTYNEVDNIGSLLEEIFTYSVAGYTIECLIVDDKSPDGTQQVVKSLMRTNKRIHLISGNKAGLGNAYLRGFAYALDTLDADIIFEMDADHSHPPSLIEQFLKAIVQADVVIGSRYIRGGDTPDWNMRRRVTSRLGNLLARYGARVRGVNDSTSGFRAIRASALRKIDRSQITTQGYAFQITLLRALLDSGARVAEIPLVFYDRKKGTSKLSLGDISEFLIVTGSIRSGLSPTMLKFGVVGGLGMMVNLLLFFVFKESIFAVFGMTQWTLLVASLMSDQISIIHNFFWHERWTFRNRRHSPITLRLLRFQAASLTSIVINNAVLLSLVFMLNMWETPAKGIGIIVAFGFNYLINSRWTWAVKP